MRFMGAWAPEPKDASRVHVEPLALVTPPRESRASGVAADTRANSKAGQTGDGRHRRAIRH